MAYHERLAARTRSPVGDGQELTEKRMFGGAGGLGRARRRRRPLAAAEALAILER